MTADALRRLAELAGLRLEDKDVDAVRRALDEHRHLVDSLDPDGLWEPADDPPSMP